MIQVGEWLGRKIANQRQERQRQEALFASIEELVQIADPKIRLARSYRTTLLEPVETAISYCSSLIAAIPGPVLLHRKSYYDDPRVKALFRSVEEMETVLREGRNAADPGEEQELFGLLTMTKDETVVYGRKQQGEMILADVPMKAVTFLDHRIIAPSPALPKTIDSLVRRSLEILAGVALEKIDSLKANLAELRERRARLSSMQRILRGKRKAAEIFAPSEQGDAIKLQEVETLLQATESEIAAARKEMETPEDALGCLRGIMAAPGATLAVREQSLKLNWMNVLVVGDEEPSQRIELAELALNEELQRSALLVSFNRQA